MDCTFRPQDWFIKSRQIGSTIFLLTMFDFEVSLVLDPSVNPPQMRYNRWQTPPSPILPPDRIKLKTCTHAHKNSTVVQSMTAKLQVHLIKSVRWTFETPACQEIHILPLILFCHSCLLSIDLQLDSKTQELKCATTIRICGLDLQE